MRDDQQYFLSAKAIVPFVKAHKFCDELSLRLRRVLWRRPYVMEMCLGRETGLITLHCHIKSTGNQHSHT